MLEVERDYLSGEWTLGKIVVALLVPVVFGGIAVALWRRSIGWALVVINAAVLFKVAWTYFFDTEGAGADAHLPAAADRTSHPKGNATSGTTSATALT
jgi:hypothetical protein